MKTTLAVLATLLFASIASAQGYGRTHQGEPHVVLVQRGSASDQQRCYQQARQFIADENTELKSKKDDGYGGGAWRFIQAHYDPKVQVCYVDYSRVASRTGASFVSQEQVADAFEGKTLAYLVWGTDGDYNETVNKKLDACMVGKAKCGSRAEFNHLLWALVPAFEDQ